MAARKRGEGRTPHRTIRAENEQWLPFKANAKKVGGDVTSVLLEFVRWFNREPGARLPQRPDKPLSAEEKAAVLAAADAAREQDPDAT